MFAYTYAGLADRLGEYGIEDNELNLRNKVSRGRFTAVFFMQCMQWTCNGFVPVT